MIRVGVTNNVTQKGLNSLSQTDAAPLECLDIFEAMSKEWAHDAWMVGYSTVEPSGQESKVWPRVNMPAVPHIEKVGGAVVTNVLVFDYDTNLNVEDRVLHDHGWTGQPQVKPKVPWTPELLQDFSEQTDLVRSCFEEWDVAFANMVYTTTNGARFIHLLSEPVPVHETEGLVRGLMNLYEEAGIIMDPACCDWTRLFRLPKVIRDNERTSESFYFRYSEQVEEFLIPQGITPGVKQYRDSYGDINVSEDARPTPEESRALRERTVNGGVAYTEAYKVAKKVLNGLDCFGCVFEERAIPSAEGRDNILMRYVGQVCSFLYAHNQRMKTQTFDMEHVYAFLHDAVEQLEPDSGTPDWLESLWSKVRRIWAREEAKEVAKIEAKQEIEATKTDKLTTILNNVKSWCSHPALHCGDPVNEATFLSGMMIACSPQLYYVMQDDGFYSSWGVRGHLLKSRVLKLGMDDLIQLTVVKDGKVDRATVDDVVTAHGLAIKAITAKTAMIGAVVQGLEHDTPTLVLSMFKRRTDLPATFSKQVDQWLKRMFDPDDYLAVCEWIGHALDFEGGPICALSVQGAPGSGKKMLAYGLKECISPTVAADGTDLVMRFNDKLMRTPLMLIDEGLPRKNAGIVDVADAFRRLVSGETITVEPKGEAKIEINNPMRVLFTANNADVVHELTGHRDLTSEDQAALAQRILHINSTETVSAWLSQQGGLSYTRGWIAGDAGQASDHVLAKHFLWLYENRGEAPGKRLLVEGNMHSEIVQEMRTQSGSAPDVIETILSIVEGPAKNISGFAIHEGRLYVTAAGILTAYRNTLDARKQLDHNKIGKVLRGLKSHGTDNNPKKITMFNGQSLRVRWWDIDVAMLLGKALKVGMRCTKVAELVREQYGDHALLAHVREDGMDVAE